MNIAQDIEQLRVSLKLTQSEIAEKLGISQAVYNQIKTGRTKKVPFEVVEKAKLLGLYKDVYNDYNENVLTFTASKENYIKQGYNPAMPGFNESQKATAITTDLGLSSAALMMICEVVAKLTGEPVGAV